MSVTDFSCRFPEGEQIVSAVGETYGERQPDRCAREPEGLEYSTPSELETRFPAGSVSVGFTYGYPSSSPSGTHERLQFSPKLKM